MRRRWLGVTSAAATLAEGAAQPAAAAGCAAKGPGRGMYDGICLGNCFDCHSLLEALPRWPRLGAASAHLDPTRVGVAEVEAFLASPEVCDIRKLFPVSLDGDIWSLASLPGGEEQLGFPGARGAVRIAVDRCRLTTSLAANAFAEARRSATACAAGAPGDGGARCRAEGARRGARALARRWASETGRPPPAETAALWASEGVVEISFAASGNETGEFLEAMSGHVEEAFRAAGAAADTVDKAILGGLAHLPLGETAAATLLGLSLRLARSARVLMEHVRTIWGLRQLIMELSGMMPNIREQLPVFRFHTGLYGRHWDVIEWLVHGLATDGGRRGRGASEAEALQSEGELRMVELGVACGPIGFHLLPRFPTLRYFGADPTITPPVKAGYAPYADRAALLEITSEELHGRLDVRDLLDFVFIDGPHTYKNVRNDIELWSPRMRSGGIVSGHDFTAAHPPLLWAVTEQRMAMGGGEVNLGMDGVWWWRAP